MGLNHPYVDAQRLDTRREGAVRSGHALRFLAVILAAAACAPGAGAPSPAADRAARAEVGDALERYMVAARRVEPEAIAAFFAPRGVLFEPGIRPIVGPDSIRAFVASFPGVRVDSATAVPDTVEVHGRTAYVWGTYYEKLAFTGQPVSEQHGRFVIEWVRQPDTRWLIERYYRVPLPSPGSAPLSP